MPLSIFYLVNSVLQRRLSLGWPFLLYAATWTTLLTATVAVASFSPELAFVSAISPSSSFSRRCQLEGHVRLPLDVPTEILCFPSHTLRKSKMDLIVPPVFAAAIVFASAYLVRSIGLWEIDAEHDIQ